MMETDPDARFDIEYKSIVIDLVERAKTYERIGRAFSDYESEIHESKLSPKELLDRAQSYQKFGKSMHLPESLLYKLRKCKLWV